jgi:hypothetical protein
MDSFIFIGFRIDCKKQPDIDLWDIGKDEFWGYIPAVYPVSGLDWSNYCWGWWPHIDGQHDSFLYTGNPDHPHDPPIYEYYCPMAIHELDGDLNDRSIDLNLSGQQYKEIYIRILGGETFNFLAKMYGGGGEVAVKWGIFKGGS